MAQARTYGVGVVGMGFGRLVHVPSFAAHDRFRLVGVSGIRPGSADAVAAERGVRAADWRSLVADPEVDLVAVATHPALHAPVTLAALEAGKHVLCEKPTALDAAEAGRMAEAARAAGRVVALSHEFRFRPARMTVKRLLGEGVVGELHSVQLTASGPGQAQLSGRPVNWLFRAETGGGFLGALASHYIDTLQWWVEREPEAVYADLRTLTADRPGAAGGRDRATADDAFTLVIGFEGGIQATVASVVGGAGFGPRWDLIGSGGALRLEDDARVWRAAPGGPEAVALPADPHAADPVSAADPRIAPFLSLLDRLAARLDGAPASADLPEIDQGLRVQRVLDGARLSHATGNRVRLVPALR